MIEFGDTKVLKKMRQYEGELILDPEDYVTACPNIECAGSIVIDNYEAELDLKEECDCCGQWRYVAAQVIDPYKLPKVYRCAHCRNQAQVTINEEGEYVINWYPPNYKI